MIGLFAHGGHDENDIVATATTPSNMICDLPDAVSIGDRGPSELLYNKSHDESR